MIGAEELKVGEAYACSGCMQVRKYQSSEGNTKVFYRVSYPKNTIFLVVDKFANHLSVLMPDGVRKTTTDELWYKYQTNNRLFFEQIT